jgi:transcriptional regulator with XRE-family HTH domain
MASCYSRTEVPKLTKLKAVRESKLMTQQELAEAAGVSPTTVSHLETGKASAQFRTIRKLADALGVKPEELLGDEG